MGHIRDGRRNSEGPRRREGQARAGSPGKGSKDAAGDPPKARALAKTPDSAVERFTNVECNQILTIKEGSGIVKSEKIRS